MTSYPVGQIFLAYIPRSEVEEHSHDLTVIRCQFIAIQREEQFERDKTRPLVAVDKRVVADDSEGIGGSQRGYIGLTVGGKIERSAQGALEKAGIAHASAAAVFSDLLVMYGEKYCWP